MGPCPLCERVTGARPAGPCPCGDSSSIAAALVGLPEGLYGWSLDRRWSRLSLSLLSRGDCPAPAGVVVVVVEPARLLPEDDDAAVLVGVVDRDTTPPAA